MKKRSNQSHKNNKIQHKKSGSRNQNQNNQPYLNEKPKQVSLHSLQQGSRSEFERYPSNPYRSYPGSHPNFEQEAYGKLSSGLRPKSNWRNNQTIKRPYWHLEDLEYPPQYDEAFRCARPTTAIYQDLRNTISTEYRDKHRVSNIRWNIALLKKGKSRETTLVNHPMSITHYSTPFLISKNRNKYSC